MLPSPFVCLFVSVWGWGFRAGSPEDGGAAAEGRRGREREDGTAQRGGGAGGLRCSAVGWPGAPLAPPDGPTAPEVPGPCPSRLSLVRRGPPSPLAHSLA